MAEDFRRYAIYWRPAPGPLADFGAAWIGWDPGAGVEVAHPDLPGLPLPVADITATPRKYGLHATIKPPFRLAEGQSAAALDAALRAFCAARAPAAAAGLRLAPVGPWLALVADGDGAGIGALAGAVVAELDAFRAPPDAAEIARRNPGALSPRQRAMLDRWGYPYVMDEFFFHVTLSGQLAPEAQAAVRAALEPVVAPLCPRPFPLDALTLCGEGADGRFREIHRYALSG
ncbi:MAG: DUF1045 domain-containing protein [Gemmobacter sp.]